MGVTNLWNILSPVKEHTPLASLQGQTIAVDLSIWVCENQCVKSMQGVVSRPYLRNLFFRVSYLTQLGVKLVFVIEGAAPQLKWQEMKRRQQALGRGGGQAGRGGRSNFNAKLRECCQLLDLMGIPYVHSNGEAEAMCATLNTAGLVDAVITDDGDAFLYGARRVYKNFTMNSKDPHVESYSTAAIQQSLGVSRESLVGVALLLGCDYLPGGVPGVGVDRVIKYLNSLKGVDLLERFKQWRTTNSPKCLNKIEMYIQQKALAVPDFPQQKIIAEFLCEQETLPKKSFMWRRPQLVLMQEFAETKMEWPSDYTTEKVVPLITLWEMSNQNANISSCLQPHRIVKMRVRQGIPVYEVEWHKQADDQKTVSEFYTTMEEQLLFGQVFPHLVKELEEENMAKKTKKKTTSRKMKKSTADEKTDEELSSQLQTLVLENEGTDRMSSAPTDEDNSQTHHRYNKHEGGKKMSAQTLINKQEKSQRNRDVVKSSVDKQQLTESAKAGNGSCLQDSVVSKENRLRTDSKSDLKGASYVQQAKTTHITDSLSDLKGKESNSLDEQDPENRSTGDSRKGFNITSQLIQQTKNNSGRSADPDSDSDNGGRSADPDSDSDNSSRSADPDSDSDNGGRSADPDSDSDNGGRSADSHSDSDKENEDVFLSLSQRLQLKLGQTSKTRSVSTGFEACLALKQKKSKRCKSVQEGIDTTNSRREKPLKFYPECHAVEHKIVENCERQPSPRSIERATTEQSESVTNLILKSTISKLEGEASEKRPGMTYSSCSLVEFEVKHPTKDQDKTSDISPRALSEKSTTNVSLVHDFTYVSDMMTVINTPEVMRHSSVLDQDESLDLESLTEKQQYELCEHDGQTWKDSFVNAKDWKELTDYQCYPEQKLDLQTRNTHTDGIDTRLKSAAGLLGAESNERHAPDGTHSSPSPETSYQSNDDLSPVKLKLLYQTPSPAPNQMKSGLSNHCSLRSALLVSQTPSPNSKRNIASISNQQTLPVTDLTLQFGNFSMQASLLNDTQISLLSDTVCVGASHRPEASLPQPGPLVKLSGMGESPLASSHFAKTDSDSPVHVGKFELTPQNIDIRQLDPNSVLSRSRYDDIVSDLNSSLSSLSLQGKMTKEESVSFRQDERNKSKIVKCGELDFTDNVSYVFDTVVGPSCSADVPCMSGKPELVDNMENMQVMQGISKEQRKSKLSLRESSFTLNQEKHMPCQEDKHIPAFVSLESDREKRETSFSETELSVKVKSSTNDIKEKGDNSLRNFYESDKLVSCKTVGSNAFTKLPNGKQNTEVLKLDFQDSKQDMCSGLHSNHSTRPISAGGVKPKQKVRLKSWTSRKQALSRLFADMSDSDIEFDEKTVNKHPKPKHETETSYQADKLISDTMSVKMFDSSSKSHSLMKETFVPPEIASNSQPTTFNSGSGEAADDSQLNITSYESPISLSDRLRHRLSNNARVALQTLSSQRDVARSLNVKPLNK